MGTCSIVTSICTPFLSNPDLLHAHDSFPSLSPVLLHSYRMAFLIALAALCVLATLIAAFVMRRREAAEDLSLFGPRLPRVMPSERQYADDEIEPGARFPRTLVADTDALKSKHHPDAYRLAPYYRHAPPYVRAPEYGSRLAQANPPG